MPEMGEVHLPGVPNVKVNGYSPKTREVFEYLADTGMVVHALLIGTKP